MRIHSITVKNYRPFKVLPNVRLGQLTTIVGKNDTGKSSMLRAIQLFFEKKPKIDVSDVHDGTSPDEDLIVEITFTSLPENIEIEEGIETTLRDEMLLDKDGHLRIRKTYPSDKPTNLRISLITWDFQDELFVGLPNLKESELNRRCKDVDIDVTKAGRGITNKSKREALRIKAREKGVEIKEYELKLLSRDELWKYIELLLPDFDLFESETKTDVSETSFQSSFRPIVKTAAEQPNVTDARSNFTGAIGKALQEEVDKIFERLKRHTDDISALTAKPVFLWDKAVSLQLYGKDHDGIDKPLEKRGSGIRRLLMVAFFEYLAEKKEEKTNNVIFGIEEPENDLHPSLQRGLAQSFRQLADLGCQIIVTSHSPVFAGVAPIEDLILIVREKGIAKTIQYPKLDTGEIAEQLGIEPADQITSYRACVFVEGHNDIVFWKTVACKLKEGCYVSASFEHKEIGFVPVGGSNLKCWVGIRAMKRLSRRFGVVVDSDRKNQADSIPQRKLNWKNQCEQDGGSFFILRKREIENYLCPNAIKESGRNLQQYDDFTDMKKLFGKNVIKVIKHMTPNEILHMDKYEENGVEHHELKEIVETLLNLA